MEDAHALTSDPRIIIVTAIVQLSTTLYFTVPVSIEKLTKNFLLGTDGSLCMR